MTVAESLFPDSATLADEIPVRRLNLVGYLLDFSKGGDKNGDVLFVTFENRASVRTSDDRLPWGFSFLKDAGYAVLGVKAKRADWYRDAELSTLFASADFHAFANSYRRVIFYGGSMGGTGALMLATPGSTVLVISPQVTLDPMLSSWETRYDEARAFDWSGDHQAVAGAARASAVYVLYDPFDRLDCKHVALLPRATLHHLRLPFLGHGVPRWILDTGLLKDLVLMVADANLTPAAWNKLARRRRNTPDYAVRMTAARPTPCVTRLCLIENLKQWWRLADTNRQNLQLQLHVMDLLTKTGQTEAAQHVGQRVQALLNLETPPPNPRL